MLRTTPYRNPPYRMPSFNSEAIGDAASNGSPKRKRNEPRKSGFIFQPELRISTTPGPEIEADEQCDSPRSKVAQRLGELDLRKADAVRESDAAGLPRKRLKRQNCQVYDDEMERFTPLPDTPAKAGSDFGGLEIAETPDCRTGAARSPTPSPAFKQTSPTASNAARPIVPTKTSPKRMRSPPPPRPADPPATLPSLLQHGSQNSSSQDTIDRTTLTWQDSEITGYDIDPTSPDDDGEGINGIGFRPTPAIAAARSKKRKQQVSEWRTREAKEARQRRFQKRQGSSDEVDCEDGEVKRGVRFAGVN